MAGIASLHGKIFLASLILVLFGGSLIWQLQDRTSHAGAADITVEHSASFGLSLSLSKNEKTRFIEIGNQGTEIIHVSLPMKWERREVRNVPLADIESSEPLLGSVRWALPPGAFVTYRSTENWSQLVVRNPSKVPFKIDLTLVNLSTSKSERDIILAKDKPIIIR